MISAIIIVRSDTFHNFMESFSDGSLAYRFKELPYFFSRFKENWLLGMVFRTSDVQFWTGVNGQFFLSDLGTLSQLFIYGVIGGPIIIYPFFRISYIAIKLWKIKSPYDVFAISVGVYTIISSALSNDIFHAKRYFGLPIILIYCEYLYHLNHKTRNYRMTSAELICAKENGLPNWETSKCTGE